MLTPETVKMLARDLYGLQLTDEAAHRLAHGAGAIITLGHQLPRPHDGVQPPFSYSALVADAAQKRSGTR